MAKLPNRHSFRAQWHDYNCGLYFITVCTQDKKYYFGQIKESKMILSNIGRELDANIRNIHQHHKDVRLVNHIVMPNHVHIVIDIGKQEITPWSNEPQNHFNSRLAVVIGGIKSHLTRYCHATGVEFEWQKKFHDHIIRSSDEFHNIMDYVDNNPVRWEQDRLNIF